jgi:hypothetical protein
MVKVYELTRFDAMTLRVPYLGQTVMANFKGGDRIRSRAKLVTSDRFIQDALEHDPRYGVLFTCVKKYEDTPAQVAKAAADKAKPRKITKVKTINDALLYFTQLGASVTGENDLKDLMEQYNVEFPNLSR